MSKLSKKLIFLVAFFMIFQFAFPQYSFAYSATNAPNEATHTSLALAKTVIFDPFANDVAPKQTVVLPQAESRTPQKVIKVEATAYSSTVDQCDGDPFTTANGEKVRDGIIAANFLPFGTVVTIPDLYGDKTFVVVDRMNSRYQYRIDIWMETREAALSFGLRYVYLVIY